jgi:hypothetical protein
MKNVELLEEIIGEIETMDSVDEVLAFLEELRDELMVNEEAASMDYTNEDNN